MLDLQIKTVIFLKRDSNLTIHNNYLFWKHGETSSHFHGFQFILNESNLRAYRNLICLIKAKNEITAWVKYFRSQEKQTNKMLNF